MHEAWEKKLVEFNLKVASDIVPDRWWGLRHGAHWKSFSNRSPVLLCSCCSPCQSWENLQCSSVTIRRTGIVFWFSVLTGFTKLSRKPWLIWMKSMTSVKRIWGSCKLESLPWSHQRREWRFSADMRQTFSQQMKQSTSFWLSCPPKTHLLLMNCRMLLRLVLSTAARTQLCHCFVI